MEGEIAMTVADEHRVQIAKKTIAMTEEMVKTMGGMTKAEARKILGLPDPGPKTKEGGNTDG